MSSRRSTIAVALISVAAFVLILIAITQQFHPERPAIHSLKGLLSPQQQHEQEQRHDALRSRRKDIDLAEKLWEQSVTDRQRMLADGFSSDPDKVIQDFINPYNVWDLLRPTFFCPFDLERIGKLGDGGKWVCGMSEYEQLSPGPSSEASPETTLVVYSFGVEHDSSFEAALLERTNAEIWGFDFSVDGWADEVPPTSSRTHFTKAAIGGEVEAERTPPRLTVEHIMAENGHRFVHVMKMDIEGAEFEALTAMMNAAEEAGERTLPVGQLLVELHLMSKDGIPRTVRDFLGWFERLERFGMRPVFNEHNWIGDVGSGHPKFIEYTFINIEHFRWSVMGGAD